MTFYGENIYWKRRGAEKSEEQSKEATGKGSKENKNCEAYFALRAKGWKAKGHTQKLRRNY